MRWRLPGARSTLPASVALLLLPVLVVPQQHPESHDYSVPHVSVPSAPAGADPIHSSAATIAVPPIVNSNDASALATLALAGSGRAVRAPPVRASSTAAGLASQLHARSLQDWEVEDFVLLATVDGTIHARDRKTGSSRWALEVPSSPLVESIYHRANRSSFDEPQPEDDFLWIV
jgi:serine/threonine-protein kinase/endoribonuclease IRE1